MVTAPAGVAAAVAVGIGQGLDVRDPIVLHERHGLIVHLRPAPVVARVTRTGSVVRADSSRIAAGLALASRPELEGLVGRPAPGVDPGPHRHDGIDVTLWDFVESAGPVDPSAAGTCLRRLHDALVRLHLDLPDYDPRPETRALLPHLRRAGRDEEAEIIRRAVAAIELPDHLPLQAIHGDAHLGNVIQSPAGPLWVDLEEVCRGPREWDIAGLLHRSRVIGSSRDHAPVALQSYGEYDEDGVDALMPALTAWIGAWATYADTLDGGPLNPWTVARLEWLQARFS